MLEEIMKLKFILEEKIKEQEREEEGELIGDLPKNVLIKLKQLRKDRNRLMEDIEVRGKQLSLEMKRRMEEEFDEIQDEYEKRHTKIWEEIYEVMEVNPEGHYFHEKGQLYQTKCDCGECEGKVIDFTKPNKQARF